jgi:hypothetical protein
MQIKPPAVEPHVVVLILACNEVAVCVVALLFIDVVNSGLAWQGMTNHRFDDEDVLRDIAVRA